MKRRAFLGAGLICGALPALAGQERFSRGLLWRVSHKSVPPSHVFGTLHDPDPTLAAWPAPVAAAFARARSLMVEFLPDPYSRERFSEAAMFLDGQTLEGHIGPADFARVVENLAPTGLEPQAVNRLKPWGALINLRSQRRADGPSMDARLVALARERRMAVSQIEEVEEQIFTFDEFPMDSQVALLRHSLAHRDELVELAERTLAAYLERDLSRIWRLREAFIARHPGMAAHQAVMTKRVLRDRSIVMAYRMQRELRRGEAFIALGALHLYGPAGVLGLLEQDGYRMHRVY
jgi:uncharacterized protein